MGVGQAILLGIVQGLTEFIPVSSSAHLVLLARGLGLRRHSLNFDVAVHLGCVLALLAYFRGEWLLLLHGGGACLRGEATPAGMLLLVLLAACVPASVTGVLLEKPARGKFRRLGQVAALTGVMGLLMIAADQRPGPYLSLPDVGWREGVLIGLAQALALLPGVSRSGITITAAVLLGLSLPAAVHFSFLLAMPLLAGAGIYGLRHLPREGLPPAERLPLLAGSLTAALVGYFTIGWMLRSIAQIHLTPFGLYRILLAVVLLLALRPGRSQSVNE